MWSMRLSFVPSSPTVPVRAIWEKQHTPHTFSRGGLKNRWSWKITKTQLNFFSFTSYFIFAPLQFVVCECFATFWANWAVPILHKYTNYTCSKLYFSARCEQDYLFIVLIVVARDYIFPFLAVVALKYFPWEFFHFIVRKLHNFPHAPMVLHVHP